MYQVHVLDFIPPDGTIDAVPLNRNTPHTFDICYFCIFVTTENTVTFQKLYLEFYLAKYDKFDTLGIVRKYTIQSNQNL
jgi:hypothetical protein